MFKAFFKACNVFKAFRIFIICLGNCPLYILCFSEHHQALSRILSWRFDQWRLRLERHFVILGISEVRVVQHATVPFWGSPLFTSRAVAYKTLQPRLRGLAVCKILLWSRRWLKRGGALSSTKQHCRITLEREDDLHDKTMSISHELKFLSQFPPPLRRFWWLLEMSFAQLSLWIDFDFLLSLFYFIYLF